MARFCTSCGTPLTGTAFCTHCGAPAAPAGPPPVAPAADDVTHRKQDGAVADEPNDVTLRKPPAGAPPTPAAVPAPIPAPTQVQNHEPARRRSGTILLVAVVALVLLLGAGVGSYLLLRSGEEPTASANDPVAESEDEPGETGETAPAADESAAPASESPAPESETPQSQRTCWDKSTVDLGADCPQVTGKRGIRWVFPTADQHWSNCSRGSASGTKVRSFNCTIPLPSGGTALATFSEFRSVSDGYDYYTRPGYIGAPDRIEDGTQIWDVASAPKNPDRWRFTMLLTDLPMSVTVADLDHDTVDEAMRVIAIRPQAERVER